MKITSIVAAAVISSSSVVMAFQCGRPLQYTQTQRRKSSSLVVREMKSSKSIDYTTYDRRRKRSSSKSSLNVATLETVVERAQDDSIILSTRDVVTQQLNSSKNIDAITKVLSASLLVTGNTVGPSMFVLPEAMGGIGMAQGTAVFVGMYFYNLISGLLLADVAINLHESSDCEVPSSFKDFVDTALQSETTGNIMAGASLVSNSCFLAFGVVVAGNMVTNTFPGLGIDPSVGAGAFASMIALFAVTQTNAGLEKIANAAVMVLFSSFAALLLPSIANVADPIGTVLAPGTNPDGFSALAAACPLILSSLSYQNIVPSITKLLNFDRTKSTVAIAIGSFLPMAMYVAWCFAALGGGLSAVEANGAGAAAFTTFTASALVGSCIPAAMSLAEETESLFSANSEDDDNCVMKNKFSPVSVGASMALPAAVGVAFANGGDLTGALHFNGAFITPFLYGLLPIILYQSVHKSEGSDKLLFNNMPQVLLGAGTICALGQELVQDISSHVTSLVV